MEDIAITKIHVDAVKNVVEMHIGVNEMCAAL